METKQETKAVVPAEKKQIQVRANESGLLVGHSFEEQYRIAAAYHEAHFLPKHYDTPAKILAGMQICYELGLKPLTSMRQIAIINETPALWGDLPLALVRNSGKLKSIKEILFDKEGKEICRENGNLNAEVDGAECTSVRTDGTIRTTVFTVADAKFARIWGGNVWAKYPKRMLQMRARGQNLKDNFSDILMGMAQAEFDFNEIPDNNAPINTAPADKASQLKEALKPREIAVEAEVMPPVIEIPAEPVKQDPPAQVEIPHDPNFDSQVELDLSGPN